MAFSRDTAASNIKPLRGAAIRKFTAGAVVAAGEVVHLETDGYVDPADCTSAADEAIGVAIQAAAAAGVVIDVVVLGPVKCLLEASPGGTVFTSTTTGEPSQTDSGNTTAVGYAESATVLFVLPEHLA